MARRLTAGVGYALAAVAAVGVAVLALLFVDEGAAPTLDQRVDAVAGDLRCPSCHGESAAQSNAPMARSMRSEVRAQLRDGRTPAQVRAWFRDRYGDDILLTPTGRPAWVLWAGPPAVLVGAVAVVLLWRRRTGAGKVPPRPGRRLDGLALVGAASTLVLVGVAVPLLAGRSTEPESAPTQAAAADAATPSAVAQRLDAEHRYDDAVGAWRRALRRQPRSPVVRTRLAFDLLRSGDSAAVPAVVRRVARRPGPQRAMALLILGLAQRNLGRPQATSTLRAFLAAAPAHPAAGQVRRILEHG